MKKYLLSSILILISTVLNAQLNNFNIYEVNRGEILKQDYVYIEHLVNNLYSATIKYKDVLDYDYYDGADLTGIIDCDENIILPFKYRFIRKMWDYENNPSNLYIQTSNVSEGKALELYEVRNNSSVFKLLDGYVSYRYFIFNKTCITAYRGRYSIYNLNTGNVTKTNFLEIQPLTDQFISTSDMTYKWGISDINGKVIFKNQFDKISMLTDSLMLVKKNDSVGVVNYNGELIIPLAFKDFSTNGNRIFVQAYNDGKVLKLDEATKNKMSTSTLTITNNDNNKSTKFTSLDLKGFKNYGLYGATDKSGRLTIPFEYELLENGIGGNIIGVKNSKLGILSPDGNVLLPIKYDNIKPYFDSFYLIKINEKFGILNNGLKQILPPVYDEIMPISNSELLVLENNRWYKFILDDEFKVLKLKTDFDATYNFNSFETYSVKQKQNVINQNYLQIYKNGKAGVASKDLSLIIPPIYNPTSTLFRGVYFEFEKDKKVFYFNTNGKELQNIEIEKGYGNAAYKNTIICKRNGKFGVIDSEGNVVVPFDYIKIVHVDGVRFIVSKQY